MPQRRAEELHDRRPIAARHPEVAYAGLRRRDRERGASVPAAGQETIEEVGKVLDRLRLPKRRYQ